MDRNDVGGELQPDKVTTSIIIVEEQNCDNLKFHQVRGGAILQVSWDQYSFLYTGHIYWYILMKCCMVACINILYWENRSAAASAVGGGGGGRVGGFMFFTRFRPFGVDLQKKNFTENFAYRNLEKFRDLWRHHGSSGKQNFQWKKIFCKSTPNRLKRVKNMKPPTRPPPPTDFAVRVR